MKKRHKIYPKSILYRFTSGEFKDISLINVFSGVLRISDVYIKSLVESMFAHFSMRGYALYTNGQFIWLTPHFILGPIDKKIYDYHNLENINSEWEKRKEKGFELIKNEWDALVEKQGYDSNVQDFSELNFNDSRTLKKIRYSFPDYFSKFICFGRPEYIDWCVNNVDDFFVEPDVLDMLELIPVQTFAGIELKKLTDTVFEIILSNNTFLYKWPSISREINLEKYDRFIMDRDAQRLSEIQDEMNEGKEVERYSERENNDDAFGGQDDAYWNID